MQNSVRYALAVMFVLPLLAVAPNLYADPPAKTALCHATSSESNPYTYLELPPSPLDNHIDSNGSPLAGHEQDFFPVDSDCDRSNDPGGDPGTDPGAVPEPITMLLFGSGIAGVGYISRRFLKKRGDEDETEA